jgi:hypothetical protein
MPATRNLCGLRQRMSSVDGCKTTIIFSVQLLKDTVYYCRDERNGTLDVAPLSSSAGSSKIKTRTSSCSKANLALLHDEVQILIFDDPAELERGERPVMVRSGRGPFRPARARSARAMHDFSRKFTKSASSTFLKRGLLWNVVSPQEYRFLAIGIRF